jgi:hypothetical protein
MSGEVLFKNRNYREHIDLEGYRPKVLLDSGAYTAFKMSKAPEGPQIRLTEERLQLYEEIVKKQGKHVNPTNLLFRLNQLPGKRIIMEPEQFVALTPQRLRLLQRLHKEAPDKSLSNIWDEMANLPGGDLPIGRTVSEMSTFARVYFGLYRRESERPQQVKEISVERYADFLDRYSKYTEAYINLDKIVPADRESAAKISRQHYLYLRQRGHRPIPVYHQGEDIKWLHQMLDDGADYIALAGASTLMSPAKEAAWYDMIWNSLVNMGGMPYLKVHALGDTKPNSLKTYPWYSVDSSSWAKQPGRAALLYIQHEGRRAAVTMRNDGLHRKNYRDIATLAGEEREIITKWMAKYGINFDDFLKRNIRDHLPRMFLSLLYYEQLADETKDHPKKITRSGLVTDGRHVDKPAIEFDKVKIYLASWMSDDFTTVYKATNYPYVLLTYAYLGGVDNAKVRHGFELMGVPECEYPDLD